MGHASTKMTLDRYGHVMPGDEDRAIEVLPVIEWEDEREWGLGASEMASLFYF